MSSHAEKELEADKLMAHGRKRTQTSLTRWHPNYSGAAEEYEQAAKIYTSLRNLPKSVDAWKSASVAHSKAKSTFFAARCMDHLGSFLADFAVQPDTPSAAALLQDASAAFEEAAGLYNLDGKLDKQSDMLVKAAGANLAISKLHGGGVKAEAGAQQQQKLSMPADGSHAVGLKDPVSEYQRLTREAISVLELAWEAVDATPHRLPDVYRGYILHCIRSGDIKEAVQAQKRMLGVVTTSPADGTYDDSKNMFRRLKQPSAAAKAGLEIIVLCLSTGDDVWAQQEMNRLGAVFGFCGTTEEQAAASLLAAYAERDADQLKDTLAHNQVFTFLSSDVSRLAKKLSIGHAAVRPPVKPQAPAQKQPPTVDGSVCTKMSEGTTSPQPAVPSNVGDCQEEDIDSDEDLR